MALAWKSNKIIAIITCRCDYQHSHFLFEIFSEYWINKMQNTLISSTGEVIFPVIASNFLTYLTNLKRNWPFYIPLLIVAGMDFIFFEDDLLVYELRLK